MQKNDQQKIHPPGGGTKNVFILGIPPQPGGRDYRKIPPTEGDLPPPIFNLKIQPCIPLSKVYENNFLKLLYL